MYGSQVTPLPQHVGGNGKALGCSWKTADRVQSVMSNGARRVWGKEEWLEIYRKIYLETSLLSFSSKRRINKRILLWLPPRGFCIRVASLCCWWILLAATKKHCCMTLHAPLAPPGEHPPHWRSTRKQASWSFHHNHKVYQFFLVSKLALLIWTIIHFWIQLYFQCPITSHTFREDNSFCLTLGLSSPVGCMFEDLHVAMMSGSGPFLCMVIYCLGLVLGRR